MVSLNNFGLFVVILVACFVSFTEGSCWRYGHSCWGGHGKRSGPPVSPFQSLRAHPKILAGLNLDSVESGTIDENTLGDASHSPDEFQTSDENSASEQGMMKQGYMEEKNTMGLDSNANASPDLALESDSPMTGTQYGRTIFQSDRLEPNYSLQEGGGDAEEAVADEVGEEIGLGEPKNSQRRHSLLYKLRVIGEQK